MMTVQRGVLILAVTLIALWSGACDDARSSSLKGQANTTIRFHGIVVDQDGAPLSGAVIQYQVEAYPKDWTFETRGRPNDVSSVSATSGDDGRFSFDVTGCFLRLQSADRDGFRHLWEQDTSDGRPTTYAYRLIAWGDLWYKTDADHPAVYVFVKDGVKEVSALPCRGGWDSGGARKFPATPNQPAWPKKPSLPDVVYKPPTTAPAPAGTLPRSVDGPRPLLGCGIPLTRPVDSQTLRA